MNKIDSNTVTSNGDDLSKSAISQAFVSHAWSLLWTSMREVNRTTSVDGWPRVATTNSPFARTKSLCLLLIAYAFLCLIPSWILRFELLCCELQPFHFASWVNALQSRDKPWPNVTTRMHKREYMDNENWTTCQRSWHAMCAPSCSTCMPHATCKKRSTKVRSAQKHPPRKPKKRVELCNLVARNGLCTALLLQNEVPIATK